MKFINYLSAISGVGIYPLISLMLFGPLFIFISIWVFTSDKKAFSHVEHIPLEDGTNGK